MLEWAAWESKQTERMELNIATTTYIIISMKARFLPTQRDF